MDGAELEWPAGDPTCDQLAEVDELLEKGQDQASLFANAFRFESVEYRSRSRSEP